MADNDRVLLDTILEQHNNALATPLPSGTAFTIFACEQALKDDDLSVDEIRSGIVDGSGDGGIDAVFTFVDGVLLAEDSDLLSEEVPVPKFRTGLPLRLHLIQAKRANGFAESALDTVTVALNDLLDLETPFEDLTPLYSDALLERIFMFRSVLNRLATVHPAFEIIFTYATRGSTKNIHARVRSKKAALEIQAAGLLARARAHVQFLGASELYRLAEKSPTYNLQVRCEESATSESGYVALVELCNYYEFITDKEGNLLRYVFDGNVRDWQGDIEVNKEITSSLKSMEGPEFWWLNNGVTILCSEVTSQGKVFTLDDVQIVNGLQTSYSIHQVMKEKEVTGETIKGMVLVRIIKTNESEVRDRIIRATNRQTAVSAASLRATDELQRKIETFFYSRGLFYDRRKNYYRNAGKPRDKIVSISGLAQAVMAMGLSRPDSARARPSTLLKSDSDYDTVFDEGTPLAAYLWAAKAQRQVDTFMLGTEAETSTQERTNLKFYVGMLATAKLLGKKVRAPGELASLGDEDRGVDEADLGECLEVVRGAMKRLEGRSGEAADKIAKGPDLVGEVLRAVGIS